MAKSGVLCGLSGSMWLSRLRKVAFYCVVVWLSEVLCEEKWLYSGEKLEKMWKKSDFVWKKWF